VNRHSWSLARLCEGTQGVEQEANTWPAEDPGYFKFRSIPYYNPNLQCLSERSWELIVASRRDSGRTISLSGLWHSGSRTTPEVES